MLKNFRAQTILRVVLLMLTMAITLWLVAVLQLYFSSLFTFLLLLLQVRDLILYVENTNRRLSQFLDAVKNEDFSQHFPHDNKGYSFKLLADAMNDVIQKFAESRKSKEEAFYYLQLVFDRSPVAMLLLDNKNRVKMCNRSFHQLVQLNPIHNLKDIQDQHEPLFNQLSQKEQPEKAQIRVAGTMGMLDLSIRTTTFSIYAEEVRLISLQNIRKEMDGQEFESWQKLMRVLTHEIMNSVTPISSLAKSAEQLLEDAEFKDKDDALQAMSTIARRSQNLLHFTERFRQLNRVSKPEPRFASLEECLDQSLNLFQEELKKQQVDVTKEYHFGKEFYFDPNLLEQVLVNLIKNALDAQSHQEIASLQLRLFSKHSKAIIEIQDGGPGISEDEAQQIFIPFYTSKEEGSGIGLSLSRQIIRQMGGQIRLIQVDKGACFRITL